MTAVELLQLSAQFTWIVLGTVAVRRAWHRPSRTDRDVALFFGAIALITVEGRVAALFDLPAEATIMRVAVIAAMALPYLLLRLVDDFAGVPRVLRWATEIGLVVSATLIVAVGIVSIPVVIYLVAYFAAVMVYAAARSAMLASTSLGVTRRRMQAVAAGSYFLGLTIAVAGLGVVIPAVAGVTAAVTQVFTLGSALSYATGFATPAALKRYWQNPELRALLQRSSTLPRSTMDEIVDDLAGVAGRALGARATIGLWDETRGVLRFRDPHGALPAEIGPGAFLGWRAFGSRQALYVADAAAAHPDHAAGYRRAGVGPVLVAPITAGDRRIGVLEVFAAREPIFAEDDLDFVGLMAQQAAVLLESRALIDDAARVRAQEETARLKEDFVSAAAHDLKTPLTTILAQAQLLERRAAREGRTSELAGVQRLVRETKQLSRLVEELLDASRLERGAFPIHRERADLGEIVREAAARERPGAERIELTVEGALEGTFDPDRMRQLVENLIENAMKYSPPESPVRVRAASEGATAHIAVSDSGIGIPAEDLPHVFDRFRRGSNVDHHRYAGIGLGLYICRGIAEQHGGRIWVESEAGRGTTFRVSLPLVSADAGRPAADASASS